MWNRDPASPSFGSFDRQYWGWKYKDFSDATMQYAVRLAVEYAKLQGNTADLPALLDAYVAYCAGIQLRDGSFNQAYPFERAPGVIYDILSTLLYVRSTPYLTGQHSREILDGTVRRAAGFALRTDENHGEVANHIAQYAYELLNYAELSGNQKARAKGQQYLQRLLSLFDADEGWFLEYDGADPGYQTRTLRYLVKIARLLDDTKLWRTAGKAADFIEQVLMPDGSIHPMLGCRSTALVYPSAFEALAIRDGNYRGLAARIRLGWSDQRVPLPSIIDFGNAIRLADDALDAAALVTDKPLPASATELPAVDHDFPRAGIAIRRQTNRIIYVGYKLGGVVVVYEKDPDERWKLIHEDSGYLLKSSTDSGAWLTRMPGSGQLVEASHRSFSINAGFYRSLHDELTPSRLLLLRLLNLTLLRFQWIADLFRKRVVRRLMSGRMSAPLSLERRITIADTKIAISDHIIDRRSRSSAGGERLLRCRRMSGTHMASSRYFQEQELTALSSGWVEVMLWPDVGGATYVTEVAFGRNRKS